MTVIDCATFEESELDVLYGELDAETSKAMDVHAAGCASCAGRLAKLRTTRARVNELLLDDLPDGLEDRVVAAAIAALPATASPTRERSERGAKIFAFLSRPQLAVAAGFVLVLGAAALYLQRGATSSAPAAASRADAPGEARIAGEATAGAPPPVAASPMPAAMGSAMALDESAASRSAPAKSKGAIGGGADGDPAFVAAKSLYDDGRCSEALPKLEAIAKTNGEADLYVARCVEQTRGCAAAAPRYDVAAKRNAGTEIGSRASLESARCYGSAGQAQAARSRYKALENDPYVATEAKVDLDALDNGSRPAASPPPAATTTATASPTTVKPTRH